MGLPLEFKEHAFMFDPLADLSPLQAILKPPQIGATVGYSIKTLWVAKNLGKEVIYTLPTVSDVHDLVNGKINRIIAQNPILSGWVKDKDNITQKQVGGNMVSFRGTFSAKQAMMVTSQLNIHDEVDASDQAVITQYETRQQASAGGWRWYFSHPSLSDFGIDKHWQKSDQKEWFITCSHCSKEQYLKWPENIHIESQKLICKYCKDEIYPKDLHNGRWVARYKDRDFSGYHITQLMCSWITPQKIIQDFNEKDPQYFHNYVLGLPFASPDSKVNEKDIMKNVTNALNDQSGRIVIGVDTGVTIWYVCMNKKGIFYWNAAKDYDELEHLLQRWPKSVIVMDAGGDLVLPRKLREKYRGRVFLASYRSDKTGEELVKFGEDNEFGTVWIDRNRMISLTAQEFKDARIPLYGTPQEWWDYWTHWSNIYRIEEITGLGTKRYKWERNGADHLVHATVYARAGASKFFTEDGGFIQTSADFKDVPIVSADGSRMEFPKLRPAIDKDWRD